MLKHSTARHDVPRSGETQYWTDHEIDRGHISPSYVSLSIEVTEEAEVEMPVPEEEHSDLDTADPAG